MVIREKAQNINLKKNFDIAEAAFLDHNNKLMHLPDRFHFTF